MSSLPREIYIDILLRLPTKSILICKSVSKSWYKLISDPDFVNLTAQRNNYILMFKNCGAIYLYSISYDSSASLFESDDAVVVQLQTPYNYLTNRSTRLLGSCNGLVYVWNGQLKFFFLWNPATKEHKRVPKLGSKIDNTFRLHGLGYDYKSGDYKLVIIIEKEENCLIQVFSLKSNSWKSFETIHYGFQYLRQESGVLFNGALHWFGRLNGKMIILSMDTSEDRFEELQLPMVVPPKQYDINMGVLEECLCVLSHNEETFEVWVMPADGVTDSWSKLYTIKYKSILGSSFYNVELIGSFKNGEILFRTRSKVISYDPRYGTARKIEIDFLDWVGVVKYSESIVSPKSITAVGQKEKKRKH